MVFGPVTRTVFEPVTRWDGRKGNCSRCGKKRSRRLRFQQTVNPFNTNPDGSIKTYEEVAIAVRQEILSSRLLPFVCAKCDRTGRDNGN